MRKNVRFLAVVVMLPGLLVGCGKRSEPEPIRLGQLVGMGSDQPLVGPHARQGAQLFVEQEQTAAERIAGRSVTVLHVDVRGDAELMQAETVRLLAVNRVAGLIGGFDAALNEQMLRAAKTYNVPVIVPGEMADAVTGDGVVVLGASPQQRGRLLAQQGQKLEARRAAVLTDPGSSVAVALTDAFLSRWRAGENHRAEQWRCRRDSNLSELAHEVAGVKPDVVLLAVPIDRFSTLRSRLASSGVNVPLLYGGEDAGLSLFQAELESAPEVYLATAYPLAPEAEVGKDFARRYEARFHEAPDLYAALSYDAAAVLFEAMKQTQSVESAAVNSRLQELDRFDSVTGPLHWHERRPQRPLFLIRLKAGKPELLRTVSS